MIGDEVIGDEVRWRGVQEYINPGYLIRVPRSQ